MSTAMTHEPKPGFQRAADTVHMCAGAGRATCVGHLRGSFQQNLVRDEEVRCSVEHYLIPLCIELQL